MKEKYYLKNGQDTLYEIVKENAEKKGSEECYSFYDFSNNEKKIIPLTRRELFSRSVEAAKIIRSNNIKKGDNVIIFSTQTVDNVIAAFASVYCGIVFTIIPPPIDESKKMRFISVLNSCKAKYILCNGLIKKKLADSLKSIKLINIEEESDSKDIFVPERIGVDDVIYLQYSSGSTSAPKGVEITYGNLISNINACYDNYKARRTFTWVPFFHNMGLVYSLFGPGINENFVAGIMSPAAFIEKPSRWIEGLSEYKAEMTSIPHSVIESYPKIVPAKSLKNIDLSNLRSIQDGSEIVNYSGMKRFAKEYEEFGMKLEKFFTGYGLAESTCAIATGFCTSENVINIDFNEYQKGKLVLVDNEGEGTIQFVSGGRIVPHTTVKIVNPETCEICKDNEFGEIWIQGPSVAKGYYMNEKATIETFKGTIEGIPGEFLRTGDLGIVINNHLYITGRAKELIIINGNNILPNDINLKLKEKINILNYSTIVPFSIEKEGKEKLIVLIELPEQIIKKIDIAEITNEINNVIFEYFEVSPYDVGILKDGELIKSDNGKVSILKSREKYLDGKFNFINSRGQEEEIACAEGNLTETELELITLIKEKLDYKVRPKDNLLSLGMDSLAVVELATIIEDRFNVVIPVSVIFEKPQINFIALYIEKSLNGEDLSNLYSDKSYLIEACKLDESITFSKYSEEKPLMKNVLITGTTGFVGAYLIYNIMERSKANAYCHVRAKSKEHGFSRIKENMKYYKLWDDNYEKRIFPIVGSVDKPKLGIEDNEYEFLCEKIDTVYHNGAILNFIYPFSRLKDTNVFGTVESIKFAATGRVKYYNYVSSYSVFDNPSYFDKEIFEDDELNAYEGYYLPYSETKWVCEKIIQIARERGLKACVYRPGEITGDSKNGIWKYSDSVSRTIKDIMINKKYADIDMNIHMTQVDYIASAIIEISKQGNTYGKAYNLLNNKIISYKELADIMKKCGYDLKMITYEEWKENLFNSGNEHPLKLLESLFKVTKKSNESMEKRYGKLEARLDCSNTKNALRGTDIECKPIDMELIQKYIKNFI